MSTNRDWINQRVPNDGIGVTDVYREGVYNFIKFALENSTSACGLLRCPCIRCVNLKFKAEDDVKYDLFRYGFLTSYTQWDLHGEIGKSSNMRRPRQRSEQPIDRDEDVYDAFEMLMDAGGQYVNVEQEEPSRVQQKSNDSASLFYKLLKESTKPLYEGCTRWTKLAAVTKLLHFKNEHGCSERGFNELLTLIRDFIPLECTLPKTYYDVKNMVKGLNLGYEKIDACEDDCMLYYDGNKMKTKCDICGKPRYKDKTSVHEKNVPRKILRYFPLAPRLQRLFMSSHTAEKMRWHKSRGTKPGELTHPADGDEWKSFDQKHPNFSREVRNVRLGLATDGFSPFSNAYSKPYSVWPVIMLVYNLPPSMCMKDSYMFMSLLIPGEKSPTKDINVYLRPLIDD